MQGGRKQVMKADTRSMKNALAAELPLLFAIFLDLVGFGMTFPDVQIRAQQYGAPGWMIGTVLASYYLVQMVAPPRWGRLSDRIGRKPVLLLCGLLSAASMVIYALGNRDRKSTRLNSS